MNDGTSLVRYDEMCRAIDQAYEADEVADIRNQAMAIEFYMRQQRNVEAERRVCEIRLRAERKLGRLISRMSRAPGTRTDIETSPHAGDRLPLADQLRDIGISVRQAEQWQKLAAVPEDDFERAFTQPEKPTTSGIITAHTAPKPQQMDERALWLWGRLQDFERMHLLDTDPRMLFGEMFEHMQETTRRLAPIVTEWLGRLR